MRRMRAVFRSVGLVLAPPLSATYVWAQSATPPLAPAAPPGSVATPAASGGMSAMTGMLLVAGLLVIVAVLVKLYDMKRKRDAEAVQLQAQLSDAFLRERGLVSAPVTPTVNVPLTSGPVIIELTGEVPDPELHARALAIVREEAARIGREFRIEDRIRVTGVAARTAA